MADVGPPASGDGPANGCQEGGASASDAGAKSATAGDAGAKAEAEQPVKKTASAKAPRLEALDAPRWFCSCMIVCYHFYVEELGKFAEWGSAWTQFFFVLSGFVLAYVEMARPASRAPKLSQLQYLRKRLVTVYPTYLFALVIKVMILRTYHPGVDWIYLPFHIFLAQSWFPVCVPLARGPKLEVDVDDAKDLPFSDTADRVEAEAKPPPQAEIICMTQRWNGVAWFMSCLIIYWLLLRPLAAHVRKYSLRRAYLSLFVLWILSVVPGMLQYTELSGVCTGYCYEMLWSALQGTSMGYYHVFMAGIVTARIFVLTAMTDAETGGPPTESTKRLALDVDRAPFVFKYGAALGYVGFILCILFVEYHKYYLFYHNGGIMPIMVLILLGCAIGVDPLTIYVFRNKYLLICGRFSYCQYLLQESVWDFTVIHIEPWSVHAQKAFFPPILLLSAYCTERFLTSPYNDWQRWRSEKKIHGCDDVLIERADRLLDRCAAFFRGGDPGGDGRYDAVAPSTVGSPGAARRGGGR